eukprot:277862_1
MTRTSIVYLASALCFAFSAVKGEICGNFVPYKLGDSCDERCNYYYGNSCTVIIITETCECCGCGTRRPTTTTSPIMATNSSSGGPTTTPTDNPSFNPTNMPSDTPSKWPTVFPSNEPSVTPTDTPTNMPSVIPSNTPTDTPSSVLTFVQFETTFLSVKTTDNEHSTLKLPQSTVIIVIVCVLGVFCCMIVLIYRLGRWLWSENNKNMITQGNVNAGIQHKQKMRKDMVQRRRFLSKHNEEHNHRSSGDMYDNDQALSGSNAQGYTVSHDVIRQNDDTGPNLVTTTASPDQPVIHAALVMSGSAKMTQGARGDPHNVHHDATNLVTTTASPGQPAIIAELVMSGSAKMTQGDSN